MKSLKYFEKKAEALRAESMDYRLIKLSELILTLMKKYRSENNISWSEYKPVYDRYFAKYH